MVSHGLTESQYDSCVYFRGLHDGSFVYLLFYVDDMLIEAKLVAEVYRLKAELKVEFDMKNLGAVKKILGMEIHRDRVVKRLCLTQMNYMKEGVDMFWYKKYQTCCYFASGSYQAFSFYGATVR